MTHQGIYNNQLDIFSILYELTNLIGQQHLVVTIVCARDKDILVYVHGAKVNFYNACAFAAQLDHFMGRDMTSMAFAWPTRQNILAYGTGADLKRAYRAARALASRGVGRREPDTVGGCPG